MQDNGFIAGKVKLGKKRKVVMIDYEYYEKMMTSLEKSEYRVLMAIIAKTKINKPDDYIKIKKRKLAINLGLSAPGVIKALRGLVEKGYIEESIEEEGKYKMVMPLDDDDDMDLYDFINAECDDDEDE